jgi:hypothetical protein
MKTVLMIIDKDECDCKEEQSTKDTMIPSNNIKNYILSKVEQYIYNGLNHPSLKILYKLIINRGNPSSSVNQTKLLQGCI